MALMLLALLACSPVDQGARPQPAPVVDTHRLITVVGAVTGWDGSGDVAIEACGEGALVDDRQHTFDLATHPGCDLRVVWERDDHRAEGPWHPFEVGESDLVTVVLPMPEPTALRPLSASEQEYREASIRKANEQLHQQAPQPAAPAGPPPPGV